MKRCEAEYQVITQDVRVKNVLAVVTQGKPQTMENIINKVGRRIPASYLLLPS